MAIPELSKDDHKSGKDRQDGEQDGEFKTSAASPDKDVSDAAAPKQEPGPAYRTSAFMLGANDGPIDDFLELVDRWEEKTGNSLFADDKGQGAKANLNEGQSHRKVLDSIASDFSPRQIRQLAASMLKLADAVDQVWDPAAVRSNFHWITRAGRIERQALKLAQAANRARDLAKRRTRHIPPEFVGEPAWEMLLELFVQFAGHADVSTKSLCLVSGLPDSSALRLIVKLEHAGLVERSQSPVDKRVTLLRLTRQGIVAVGSILAEYDN